MDDLGKIQELARECARTANDKRPFEERVHAEAVIHNTLNKHLPLALSIAHIKYCFYQTRWSSKNKTKIDELRTGWKDMQTLAVEGPKELVEDRTIDTGDVEAASVLFAMVCCGMRAKTISQLIGLDIWKVKAYLVTAYENSFWNEKAQFCCEWVVDDGIEPIGFMLDMMVLQGLVKRQ